MSTTHHSLVKHQEAMSFVVRQNGHEFLMDADEASGGQDKGVRPKALMLSALAGCTGMDVVSLLNKMHVKFQDLSIEVAAELTEEHPRTYSSTEIIYHIRLASEEDKAKLEKAVSLSQEKYCGVNAMFRKFSEVSFRINYL
jgi:putative redox protein